jgi:uncharacterized membrane protein
MAINAQQEQAKSAKTSRRTFAAGCILTVAAFILAGVFGWNMICNIVAAIAIINLVLSLYHGYKAEKLAKIEKIENA